VKSLNNDAIVNNLFKAASYTYGPLMGLFAFGMLTKRQLKEWKIGDLNLKDSLALVVALLAILITYQLDVNSKEWFGGFTFGFTTLAVNGLLMFIGLFAISSPNK
jgi:hypothetical protein